MNKSPAPKREATESQTGDSEESKAPPARRSAMKLPPGVGPKSSGSPPAGRGPGWDRSQQGRPQRDAARRAGKSRKVH